MTQAETFKHRRAAFADDDSNVIEMEKALLSDIR